MPAFDETALHDDGQPTEEQRESIPIYPYPSQRGASGDAASNGSHSSEVSSTADLSQNTWHGAGDQTPPTGEVRYSSSIASPTHKSQIAPADNQSPIHKLHATENTTLVDRPAESVTEKRYTEGARPRRAARHDWPTLLSDVAMDVILIACSLGFLGFAILAHHYDQAPVDKHQHLTAGLRRATKYGPTIFPILFAAVVGRATKHWIFWRLERGERLGLLDILASSTTVVNAVLSQVSLRSFSLVGCAIALVWACSPVGGQAALRIMTVGVTDITRAIQLDYMSTNSSLEGWYLANAGPKETVASGVYVASILSPERVKTSPLDTWNNVKIPMIEALNRTASTDVSGTWHDVPLDNVTYSALVGLPVLGVEQDVTSIFVIDTSYWTLACPLIHEWTGDEEDNLFSNTNSTRNSTGNPGGEWEGIHGSYITGVLQAHRSDGLHCNRTMSGDLQPRAVGYIASSQRLSSTLGRLQALCYITTSYVDVQVSCSAGSCRAGKIRRSTRPHPPAAWTTLDEDSCAAWSFFAPNFLNAVPAPGSAQGTIVEGYLADPAGPTRQDEGVPYPWDVGTEAFATRFAQLLNSYWLAAVGWEVVPNGQANNDTVTDFSTSAGQSTKRVAVIECHDAWFAVLLVISLFLAFASGMPAVIRMWTRAPVLLFNISDMLKDSPYLFGPVMSSTLNSSDRARTLKNVKVKYGDVAPESEVGHIAIGSTQSVRGVERVRGSRLYD